MKKETIVTTTINYSFYFEDFKTVRRFEITDDIFFCYTPIKLGGFNLLIENKDNIKFGCERPKISEIERVLKFLKNEGIPKELYYVDERGQKLFKKKDVIDESKNFYITNVNRLYKKSDVDGEAEFEEELKDLRKTWDRKWAYKGHILGNTNGDVINKLQYILDTMSNLKRAMAECEK